MTTNYKPSHSLIVSRVEIKKYVKCGSPCSSFMAYNRETNGVSLVCWNYWSEMGGHLDVDVGTRLIQSLASTVCRTSNILYLSCFVCLKRETRNLSEVHNKLLSTNILRWYTSGLSTKSLTPWCNEQGLKMNACFPIPLTLPLTLTRGNNCSCILEGSILSPLYKPVNNNDRLKTSREGPISASSTGTFHTERDCIIWIRQLETVNRRTLASSQHTFGVLPPPLHPVSLSQ